MFDQKQENADAVAKAIEVLAKYGPGDVVPHFELAQAIGSNPPEPRYYRLARKARERHCASSSVWTREVPGIGFRFLSPSEMLTDEQQHRTRKARRQFGIANNVAESIPDEKLTHHERKLKAFRLDANRAATKLIRDEERQAKWLLRPTSDKPRIADTGTA